MKKRAIVLFLVMVLAFCTVTHACAATEAYRVVPQLSFSGTTANCKVSITQAGQTIDATLELWKGSVKVASWHDTATTRLVISKTRTVVSGQTYTLKVSGTIGGVPFTGTSVTGTC